jgi:hypothetical protein
MTILVELSHKLIYGSMPRDSSTTCTLAESALSNLSLLTASSPLPPPPSPPPPPPSSSYPALSVLYLALSYFHLRISISAINHEGKNIPLLVDFACGADLFLKIVDPGGQTLSNAEVLAHIRSLKTKYESQGRASSIPEDLSNAMRDV